MRVSVTSREQTDRYCESLLSMQERCKQRGLDFKTEMTALAELWIGMDSITPPQSSASPARGLRATQPSAVASYRLPALDTPPPDHTKRAPTCKEPVLKRVEHLLEDGIPRSRDEIAAAIGSSKSSVATAMLKHPSKFSERQRTGKIKYWVLSETS